MKRIVSLGMLALCLAKPIFAQSRLPDEIFGAEYFEDEREFSEKEIQRLREELKDVERLRKYLRSFFMGGLFLDDVPPLFKQKFDVDDETMQTALMNIISESSATARWLDFKAGDLHEISKAKHLLATSTEWLGVCADAEGKKYLMDIATDDAKAGLYRERAIGAYLLRADAQETRGALIGFVVNMRQGIRGIYHVIMQTYDKAESDPQKREAIVASLIVILAREENRGLFAMMDKNLAERNKEYATSRQRLAMLQRMSKLPPTTWYGDGAKSLDPALASFRFRFFKTNVSTNLTELMARDFGKPE